MTGFFRDIRGYFQSKYSGRYLALILRELARKEPKSFAEILAHAARKGHSQALLKVARQVRQNKLEADSEVQFQGRDQDRWADLAFRHQGKIVLLFEVKEFDWKNERNVKQTEDYLAVVSSEDVPFVHLSRFAPDAPDRELIQKQSERGHPVISIRYRDVYAALERIDRPVAQMVRDYLEDIGVANYRKIDLAPRAARSMAFLLVKMLGFPHAHGKKRLESERAVSELPGILQTVFGNLQFLGDVLKERNEATIRTRFTMNFRPYPELDLPRLAKVLAKEQPDDVDFLPGVYGRFVKSGHVSFSAIGKIHSPPKAKQKLRKDDFLYVQIGYDFEIATGKDEKLIRPYVWAGFFAGSFNVSRKRECKSFPTEQQAIRLIHDCLKLSLPNAKAEAIGAYRKALKSFVLPPRP